MAEVQKGKGAGKGAPARPKAKAGAVLLGRTMTVLVRKGLSGEEAAFQTHCEDRVVHFKDHISKRWRVPPVCQRLLVTTGAGDRILEDRDIFGRFRPDQGDLCVTLLISTSRATEFMSSPQLEHRMQAATAFSELAHESPSEVLPMLLRLLEDPQPMVRIQAARGLSSVAKDGNEDYIAHLGTCLGFDFHDDLNECTAATEAVAYLLSQGNEAAWRLVRGLLQQANPMVSLEAVRVLAIGAFFYDDERSLVAFRECLADPAADMRKAAVAIIPGSADVGDARAVSALVERISDEDAETRRLATAGLGSRAAIGDQHVVSVLLQLLVDPACTCRDVALGAISKVARVGDPEVVPAVLAVVHDAQGPPAALTALARIAAPGDAAAIDALLSRLSASDWNIRGAAIASLSRLVANPADSRLLSALRTGAQDTHVEVRVLSVYLLAECAKAGVDEALALLGECKLDSEEQVRGIASDMVEMAAKARAGDTVAQRVSAGNLKRVWRQWSVDPASKG